MKKTFVFVMKICSGESTVINEMVFMLFSKQLLYCIITL